MIVPTKEKREDSILKTDVLKQFAEIVFIQSYNFKDCKLLWKASEVEGE